MFFLYFLGCDILRNVFWLVDLKNNKNCLLLEDLKFYFVFFFKVGIKEKYYKK